MQEKKNQGYGETRYDFKSHTLLHTFLFSDSIDYNIEKNI